MAQTVGDHIVERLREWDVDRVFGYAGDGINGLLGAFGRADNDPRFIEARHEEMAASRRVRRWAAPTSKMVPSSMGYSPPEIRTPTTRSPALPRSSAPASGSRSSWARVPGAPSTT